MVNFLREFNNYLRNRLLCTAGMRKCKICTVVRSIIMSSFISLISFFFFDHWSWIRSHHTDNWLHEKHKPKNELNRCDNNTECNSAEFKKVPLRLCKECYGKRVLAAQSHNRCSFELNHAWKGKRKRFHIDWLYGNWEKSSSSSSSSTIVLRIFRLFLFVFFCSILGQKICY